MPIVISLRRLPALGDHGRCHVFRLHGKSSGVVCFSGPASVLSPGELVSLTHQAQFCDNQPLALKTMSHCPITKSCSPDSSVADAVQRLDACGTQDCNSAKELSVSGPGEESELQAPGSSKTPVLDFPPVFLQFLQQNQLDPSIYRAAHTLPRYVRLKANCQGDRACIEEELETELSPVLWLPGFFCIPSEIRLAGSQAYQHGKIFGMDVASGAAVAALEIMCGDDVLDLCAAPGAKLCMMAELLGSSGTLTAVDISAPRLAACRTMLQKYNLESKCRLFLGDGTLFSLLPIKAGLRMSASNQATLAAGCDLRGRSNGNVVGEWTSKKTKREKRASKRAKRFGNLMNTGPELFFYGKESGVVGMSMSAILGLSYEHEGGESLSGYDKVLVDAECTHDGSFKHILKYEEWGWDTFERRFLNEERLSSITQLQLQLLTNGFRLLKPHGTLVYSTCSLTQAQNEGVVERFLSTTPLAELKRIDVSTQWPCKSGMLSHTLRFDPITSNTSGLFIAKIVKKTRVSIVET